MTRTTLCVSQELKVGENFARSSRWLVLVDRLAGAGYTGLTGCLPCTAATLLTSIHQVCAQPQPHSFQPFSTYFSSYTSTNCFFYSTFVGWKFGSFSRLLSSIKPGLKSAVFSLQVIWSIIIVTNLCWPFVSLHPRSMSTIPLLELDLACQGWRRR